MSDEDGATFVFNILIANQATQGAGDIELVYTAGEGNEFELLYGMVENLAGQATRIIVRIDFGTNGEDIVWVLDNNTLADTGMTAFPSPSANAQSTALESALDKIPKISGPCRLRIQAVNVPDGQDIRFSGALRIKAGIPTRATVGQGTEVVTVTAERVV